MMRVGWSIIRLPAAAALALLCLLIPMDAGAQATVPGAPTIDTVTARAGWLLVEWSAPSSNGGSTITAYDARYIETDATDKADGQWTEVDDAWATGQGGPRYGLDGLTNDTEYDVQVRAVNVEGDGAWSATVTGTPTLSDATRATIAAVRGDDGAVAVTWNAPTTLVDTDTTYDLRYIQTDAADKTDDQWTEVVDAGVDDRLLHGITGLTLDTEYDVQVRAVEFAVAGSWSDTTTGTPADSGQDLANAREITLATTSSGELDPMGDNYFWGKITDGATFGGYHHSSDWDYFKIVITDEQAPDPVGFLFFTGGILDSVGRLYDSNGTSITSNGSNSELDNPDAFVIRRTLEAGTYYLRVRGDGSAIGEYVLRIQTGPDTNDRIDPGTTDPTDLDTLTVGSSVTGLISPPDEIDSYDLELTERTDVIIRSLGTDLTGQLLNEDGALLARNDDGNLFPEFEGFVIRQLLDAGTYELKVSSHLQRTSGVYDLYVSDAGDPGSTIADAQALNLGLEHAAGGNITSSTDVDYFSITVADLTYVLIWATANTSGTDVNAELVDAGGTTIDANFNSDFAGQYKNRVSFAIAHRLEAGTHYVKVNGAGGSTGKYTILAVDDFGSTRVEETCKDVPRGGISDTWYGCQWHLQDDGLRGSVSMEDINVEGVWSGGNLGEGITVAVVDDGIDHHHEDLTANVDTAKNHDFGNQGGIYHPFKTHGTEVAGLIAARDNDIGMRGVAPRATIYGYNYLLSGTFGDEVKTASLNADTTAVNNNSWGSRGSGGGHELVTSMWEEAIETAVNSGYGGKGVFFVWGAGNGARAGGHSSRDERTNFYAVTAACGVDRDGVRTFYSEPGSNLWVCAPASHGSGVHMATTVPNNRYTTTFGGTSAAAPIVSGVAALVRKANSALTWRDVKLILAASARKNDADNDGWEEGADKYGDTGKYNFNHEYGFGVVDAQAAVNLADGWTNLPGLRKSTAQSGEINISIPDATGSIPGTTVTQKLTLDDHVEFIEYIHVVPDITHPEFVNLEVEVESPSGTVSKLSPHFDKSGYNTTTPFSWLSGPLRLGSARHLGENPAGEWTLRLTDHVSGEQGTLESWSITAYGHGTKPAPPRIDEAQPASGAFTVIWETPADPGKSAITGYQVHYIRSDAADKSDGEWTSATAGESARQHTASGLGGDVEYDVRVRAVSALGNGEWSETETVTTGALDAPAITSLLGVDETFTVKWTAPADSSLGAITSYDLRLKPTNRGDWHEYDSVWTSTAGGPLEHTLVPTVLLGYGWSYYVQMRAVVGTTEHPWSASRTVVTVPRPPYIISVTADPDGNKLVVAQTIAISSFFPITSYDLRYIESSEDETIDENWTVKTNVPYVRGVTTIGGLTNWVSYDVQVRARNAGGPGSWSETETGTPSNTDVGLTLEWEETSVHANEDGGSVTLKAIVTTDSDETLPADFSLDATVTTEDGTDTDPDDYAPSSGSTLTFDQSDFERVMTSSGYRYQATREYTFTISDDAVDEDDETFTATLAFVDSANPNFETRNAVATVTIRDDEQVPVTLGWLNDTVSVNEGAGTVSLDATATTTVDKRPESGFSFRATIATSDGSGSDGAVAGEDYTHVSTTVTFQDTDAWSAVGSGADRRYRATKRVAVPISNDAKDERDETFTATVEYADASPPSHLQGGSADVTVTIADNDLPPVSIRADTASAQEGGALRFTLTRDGVDDDALPVNVRVSETGRMLASNQPTTVTFMAGDATAILSVALADDTEDEDNSIVTATVQSGSGYALASDSSATATALDNDHVPVTLSWDRTAITVAERAGAVTLRGVATTTRDKQPESGFSFTATLTATPGTADAGDYSVVTTSANFRQSDFTRTMVGGGYRYRATQDYTVNIVSSDGDETDETFTATLTYADPSLPYLQGGSATATVTISDSDRPLVTVNADAASATEADANITFTLQRDGPTTSALPVNLRVTESGAMLSRTGSYSITFAVGSSDASLELNLTDDTEDEANSTVTVEVVAGGGYLPGSPSSATTDLTDDDHVPVTLEWEAAALTVAEGVGSVTLTALATTTKDKAPESGFTFDAMVTVSDGNAANPDDYEPPSSPTLTFNAGSSFRQVTINGQNRYQAEETFRIAIEPDNEHEQDENFTARLAYANPGDPHLRGSNSTARVTITDNDPVPLALGWERPEWSVTESDGSVTLKAVAITTINRRPEDGFSFDATVSTSGGTASQGSDFTGLSATETFLSNDFDRVALDGQSRYQAEKEFTIEIRGGGSNEPNENFIVRLGYDGGSPHVNLTTGVAEATVWIIENRAAAADVQLTRNSSPGGVSEGATLTYEYTVMNNGPATATGLRLVVHLDPNVRADTADLPSGCSLSGGPPGGVVTCNIDDLGSGESVEVSIEVTVESVSGDGIVNRAYVAGSVADPTPGNNTYPSTSTGGGNGGTGGGGNGGGGGSGGGGAAGSAPPVSNSPAFLDAEGNEITTTTRQIAEDAALDTAVGVPVTATDPDGDALTYSLSGDGAAKFAINPSTGQLTTKTTLDHESQPSHAVTVTASDPSGETAQVQVTITVTDVDFDCSSGSAVADAANQPGLVADCEALLETRDKLAGSGSLNWSEDTPIAEWEGVTLSGTPQRVTRLRLHRKGLDGGVPADLGGLSGLVELSLYRNSLTGDIPAELGNLSNLRWLYLHSNKSLEGDGLRGPIPASFGNLANLELLFLYGNSLSGAIPTELGQLANMRTLLLHENEFTGQIPGELGDLPSLRYLWLDDNNLSGRIPAELGDLSSLRWLSLYGNNLSGAIPTELADLSGLRLLILDRNQLSGAIPSRLGELSELTWLDLNDNNLSGAIPGELGNLSNLEHLYLHNNDLTGPVPAGLGRLSNLTNLWLRDNGLSGQIPASLDDLPNLQRVRIAGNAFTGCVPAGLLGGPRWYSDAEELGLPACGP